ncbi:hypothetical protein [Phenylobacterium sp.]
MHTDPTCREDEVLRRDPVRRAIFFVCVALILAPSMVGLVGMILNG